MRHGWRASLRCQQKKYLGGMGPRESIPCHVSVRLRQKAEIDEQTVLGFSFDDGESYKIRIPIVPQAPLLELEEYSTRIECLPNNEVQIDIDLPDVPNQVAVDPDQVLIDRNPANNYWKPRIRGRLTPLLTMLDETDLTNAYDRWNITAGPWFFTPTYDNPWFTRSTRSAPRRDLPHAGVRWRRLCRLPHGLPRHRRRGRCHLVSPALGPHRVRLRLRAPPCRLRGGRNPGQPGRPLRPLHLRLRRQPVSTAVPLSGGVHDDAERPAAAGAAVRRPAPTASRKIPPPDFTITSTT